MIIIQRMVSTSTMQVLLILSRLCLDDYSGGYDGGRSGGGGYGTYIAANLSDFGGILPIFKQNSAIPIGMTVFRQNLKNLKSVKTTLNGARRFILLNTYVQALHPVKYCLGDTAACNGVCDWLVGALLANE